MSLIFRPQMLLLFPALLLSLDQRARPSGGPVTKTLRALLEWGAPGVQAAVILGILPLAAGGLISDFLSSLAMASRRPTAEPTSSDRPTAIYLPRLSVFLFVPLIVCLLFPGGRTDLARRACEIAVAPGGIALYKALSPVYFPYHEIPQIATLSLAVIFMAGMIRATSLSAPVQTTTLLLLFMFAIPQCPRFALVSLEPPVVAILRFSLSLAPHSQRGIFPARYLRASTTDKSTAGTRFGT